MVLLSILPLEIVANASAIAKTLVLLSATVKDIFLNLIVIPAGIHHAIAILMAITFTSLLLLITYNDLPVFPLLERASRHDMLSFLHTFFTMKSYLPTFNIKKLLLDSAMDAYPLYDYCRDQGITPFIDLKRTNNGNFKYKNDFTIDKDGVPICKMGLRMKRDGHEKAKYRSKYRCPKANRKLGYFCENACSDSKYGRTVHLTQKDNPRLFNIPPRDSNAWKKEYDRRTSVERSNKREKNDYKLESGKHRSSKKCGIAASMQS